MSQLFVDNDNYVYIERLRDAISKIHIIDATITVTVKDLDGNTVTNASNLPVTYISGTHSQYSGIIPANADLNPGQQYQVILQSSNYGFQIVRTVKAVTRQ